MAILVDVEGRLWSNSEHPYLQLDDGSIGEYRRVLNDLPLISKVVMSINERELRTENITVFNTVFNEHHELETEQLNAKELLFVLTNDGRIIDMSTGLPIPHKRKIIQACSEGMSIRILDDKGRLCGYNVLLPSSTYCIRTGNVTHLSSMGHTKVFTICDLINIDNSDFRVGPVKSVRNNIAFLENGSIVRLFNRPRSSRDNLNIFNIGEEFIDAISDHQQINDHVIYINESKELRQITMINKTIIIEPISTTLDIIPNRFLLINNRMTVEDVNGEVYQFDRLTDNPIQLTPLNLPFKLYGYVPVRTNIKRSIIVESS